MGIKQVSIIIPVFNVEEYLPECLDSVCGQIYQNLQIILVDDGSNDHSGSICDMYAERDSRITVIHKGNGGLSDARNVGIELATGDFIFFLDSDDYLESTAIQTLVEEQSRAHSEIVLGNFFYKYTSSENTAPMSYGETTVLSNFQAMHDLTVGKIETFAWGKLICSDLVKGQLFPVGKLFEDHFWTHYVFGKANQISIITKPLVHYRQRNNSISYTFTPERLDILDGWEERIAFLEKEYPGFLSEYKCVLSNRYVSMAWLVLTRIKKEKRKAFCRMRRFNEVYRLSDYALKKDKDLISALDKGNLNYAFRAVFNKLLNI